MLDLIIKNGCIINACGELTADLAIKDGTIVEIGRAEFFPQAVKVVDAAGLLVMPGMIDSHAHIHSYTSEDACSLDNYKDASIAAAYGGTTSIIDFALPNLTETPAQAMDKKLKEVHGECVINYSFHSGLNRNDEQCLDDIRQLRKDGFPSVKIFTIYRSNLMLDKPGTLAVMRDAAKDGGLVMVHAECAELVEYNIAQAIAHGKTTPRDHANCRPVVTELEAMSSILTMQRETGAPILFAHMTTGQAGALLRCQDHSRVFTEVCPHYLTLTDEVYDREDSYKFVCSPPIRQLKEQEGLWKLIAGGDVDIVNSDHTDYSIAQKVVSKDYFPKIPNGLPTLETRGVALWSEGVAKGRITPSRFVELTSAKTAQLMGLYPRKGVIQIGADADIVLFDPNFKKVHTIAGLHMQTDYTPYEGVEFTGRVVDTIIGGHLVIEQGVYVHSDFRGTLLKRSAFES